MSCDMFSRSEAKELLRGKFLYFVGDSNMRALYKDLVWLLENGSLISISKLRKRNEESHASDRRISNGVLHSGRDYEEVREYKQNPYINFQFITRLHLRSFIANFKNLRRSPDIVVINSCVWDLTRWGPNGVEQYKTNINKTFAFLKSQIPSARVIWLTTLPPTFKSQGGYLKKEIEFVRSMLPWHVVYANKYASDLAYSFKIDVLDLCYNFRLLMDYHHKDGIHWNPIAMRHMTNTLLTHIALVWNHKLPGRFELDKKFLERSQVMKKKSKSKGVQRSQVRKKRSKSKGVLQNLQVQQQRNRHEQTRNSVKKTASLTTIEKAKNQRELKK